VPEIDANHYTITTHDDSIAASARSCARADAAGAGRLGNRRTGGPLGAVGTAAEGFPALRRRKPDQVMTP
jgi:hypothetical protein